MGEAKRRRDAREEAFANGLPWRPNPRCPGCGSHDIAFGALADAPQVVVKHFTSDIATCCACNAIWEPLPATHVEDAVCSAPCDNCAFRAGSPEQADPVKWREMIDRLKPGADGWFQEMFYCHKNVPIDMSKGPGNFLFPRKPVTMDGAPLQQADGSVVTTEDVSKMRVCSGFLRMFWANRRKMEAAP